MRILICALAVLFSACTTTGKWAHQSGAEGARTDKDNDTALVKTGWGNIRLFPKQHDRFGFHIEVTVQNDSNDTIEFKSQHIAMQAESGELIDPLTQQELATKAGAAVSFTSGIVGGNYLSNAAATGMVTENLFASLIKDGPIPSHSSRKGIIIFDTKDKTPADFSFRIYPALAGSEYKITFGASAPQRSTASEKRRW